MCRCASVHVKWHVARSLEEASPFVKRGSKELAALPWRKTRPTGFAKERADRTARQVARTAEQDVRDFQRNLKIYEKVRVCLSVCVH